MNPEQLLQTIYLGDRGCKAVMIDSCNQRVAIQVDVISRLRPGAKTWDFYSDEDIKDGWLVFTDVRSVRFEPSGPLPNDLINDVSVKALDSSGSQLGYFFELPLDPWMRPAIRRRFLSKSKRATCISKTRRSQVLKSPADARSIV